jgi:DNA-directed RNA polymerase specialized sigma24 family protein
MKAYELTDEQRALVDSNLRIARQFVGHIKQRAIASRPWAEIGPLLDDLLADAYTDLCEAAVCWQPDKGSFKPFAWGVMERRYITRTVAERREMRDPALATSIERLADVASWEPTAAQHVESEAVYNVWLERAAASMTPLEIGSLLGIIQGDSYADMSERFSVLPKGIDNAIQRAKYKARKAYVG